MYNTDAKSNLINALRIELADKVDHDTANLFINTLLVKLSNYELTEKSTDIVVSNDGAYSVLQLYLATKKIEGRSDKTIDGYKRRLVDAIQTINKPLTDITVYDLRMWLAKKKMDGCSDRTVSSYRSVMTSFFNWAFGEGLIDKNPVQNLGVIKYRRDVKLPFSKVDIVKLREGTANVKYRAVIETLLATGCRISELCGIKLSDVDFDNHEIKVLGKGNKERMVYFDSVTDLWIKKYLESRKYDSEYLFSNKTTGNLKPNAVRLYLHKIEIECGVENVHPHRFRRTLATSLIQRGMDIQEVAAILGHENINTTMTYVHMNDDAVKASYAKCLS